MENFFIIQVQVLKMLGISLLGYFISNLGWLKKKTIKDLSFLLIWIINPIVIFTSYQKVLEINQLKKLGISLIASALIMIFIFILSGLLTKNKVEKLALGFGNAGFMGIPIVFGISGFNGVFFLSAYIAFFNIFCYTYGIYLISGNSKNISLKSLLNPGFLSVILGLIFYIFSIKTPALIIRSFNFVTNFNTPLAMIILGTFFSKIEISNMIGRKRNYIVSFYKLLLYPLLVLFLLKLIPFLDNIQKLVLLIAIATPTGITIPIIVKMYEEDYVYATELVGLGTILSTFSIPTIIFLSYFVL